MAKQVGQTLRKERLLSALSVAFGALALTLACIGLYGILSYAVTRRTSEMGIRIALGATAGELVRLILREASVLVLGGILAGVPAVWLLAGVSRALLYGIGSFDWPGFASALLILSLFAAIAAIIPARRAGRLDPMSALRCE
jgi:ABC-type antimicrobial peptide transport system permease subunit